jgi:hypothetical protein
MEVGYVVVEMTLVRLWETAAFASARKWQSHGSRRSEPSHRWNVGCALAPSTSATLQLQPDRVPVGLPF